MKTLIFDCQDGTTAEVKERTRAQMRQVMRRYMTDAEIAKCSYIEGSQFISEMNGNIYAKFVETETNGSKHDTVLFVADNNDYINELIYKP